MASTSTQPPSDEKKGDHINIKLVDGEQNEIFFKIKKTTPLRKLMEAYCDKQGKQFGTVRFIFEGTRLSANNTAEEVGLENDDIIEAKIEQTGGRVEFIFQ